MPEDEWKWRHNLPKSMGHSKSSPEMEIHSITGPPQERKISKQTHKQINNNVILHLRNYKKNKQISKLVKGMK